MQHMVQLTKTQCLPILATPAPMQHVMQTKGVVGTPESLDAARHVVAVDTIVEHTVPVVYCNSPWRQHISCIAASAYLHAVGGPPGLGNAGHQAKHGHPGMLHKHPEVPPQRGPLEEGYGSPIQQGCKDQPGTHHPAQIGGPGYGVTLTYIMVEEGIGCTADWGDMGPGNCLGLPCNNKTFFGDSKLAGTED